MPSFILPSAPVYEEGTLYGLELYGSNFVPSPMSFTRATTATRVNSDGLVELVPYNLLEYSQKFDNAYWTKGNATVTPNITTAPDGTLTAYKLVEDTVNTSHTVRRDSGLNSFTCSISVFVKKAERSFVRLLFQNTGDGIVDVNLNNGAILSQGILISSVTATAYEDDWYRIEATTVVGATPFQATLRILTGLDATTYSYTGDGTSGIYIWGAQLVEGTDALPYLKTETRLNRPRVDFSLPGCPNLLLEPQRTNTLIYSDQFDNAAWVKLNGTITPNTIASPSDISNADTFTDNSTNAAHCLVRYGQWSTTQQTFSIYVKPDTLTKFYIANGSLGSAVFFDLTTGTIEGTITGFASPMINNTITPMANGWFRLSSTHTTSSGGTLQTGFYKVFNPTSLGLSSSYIGTGQTAYVWGAQLEVGDYATSYIPTTATSVTRNAEILTRSNIYTNGLITAAGGTLFVDIRDNIELIRLNAGGGIFLNTGTVSTTGDGFTIRNSGSSSSRITIQKVISGTASSIYFTTTDTIKVAIKWNGTTADVFVDGVKVVEGTSFTTTAMENLFLDGGNRRFYVNSMYLYPTPLSDDELEALTGLGFNTYEEMANYYNYITQ